MTAFFLHEILVLKNTGQGTAMLHTRNICLKKPDLRKLHREMHRTRAG